MLTPIVLVAISGGVFALLITLYAVEDARGGRIVLPRAREHADRGAQFVAERFLKSGIRISVWSLNVLLEHGVKRLLQKLVDVMYSIEGKIEQLIRQHRSIHHRSSGERERNHLDDIQEHKEESALSEEERDRLRSHE